MTGYIDYNDVACGETCVAEPSPKRVVVPTGLVADLDYDW